MTNLPQIHATPKTGNEQFTDNNIGTRHSLIDFWRWSVSDLVSNATRGILAEFIVGTAIGIETMGLRDEWDAFDLITKEGIKIEVKSSAYIQCWGQKKHSVISFSIKKTKSWDPEIDKRILESKRHADIYVMCHLKHTDQETIDPMKMEQWDFYVLPTSRLDSYERSQSSITINSLRRLTEPKQYSELKTEIEKAYLEQSNHNPPTPPCPK